jgi:GT2 family glycosyltransferase
MLNIDTRPSISVLITCHNRKNKTLECLRLLFLQNGLDTDFYIKVFLVDDASTDGTSEAIVTLFPEVRIIQGTGNLFWNRGMHLAGKVAREESNPDFYLWLNDDTFLFPDAIIQGLNSMQNQSINIICGSTCDSIGNFTYGGYSKKGIKLKPNNYIQDCYYCNGNFLLIQSETINLIGFNDPIFSHSLGDFDYTHRAKKAGIKLSVMPEYAGVCNLNESIPKWLNKNHNLLQRIKFLYEPLSGCIPNEFFIYSYRKSGLTLAILHYFSLHLRCFFPDLWRKIRQQ